MNPVSVDELRQMPGTVNVETAARALGVSRSSACDAIRRDEFPVQVLYVGSRIRVVTAGLIALLDPEGGQAPAA